MISLRSVTKEYNLDDEMAITPVRRVSLDISEGEFVMITGRSGSGKTTLLNLVAGLIKPTSGEVLIDGASLGGMTDKELAILRSQKIGFIFQFPSLLPSLTVLENVALPAVFAHKIGKKEAERRASNLLRTVGLAERMGVYPRQLSAGEQKRAVIARSLINGPEILLADEPTSDLDEQTEEEIMLLLREIHSTGVTLLMVTHSLKLLPLATRTLRMANGALMAMVR